MQLKKWILPLLSLILIIGMPFLYFNGFFNLKSTERHTEILTFPSTTANIQSTPTTTNAPPPISSSDLKRFGETIPKSDFWEFVCDDSNIYYLCGMSTYQQVRSIGEIILNNEILQLLFPNSDISNKDYDFKSYCEECHLIYDVESNDQYFYKIAFVDVSRKRSKQKEFREEKQREEIRQSISKLIMMSHQKRQVELDCLRKSLPFNGYVNFYPGDSHNLLSKETSNQLQYTYLQNVISASITKSELAKDRKAETASNGIKEENYFEYIKNNSEIFDKRILDIDLINHEQYNFVILIISIEHDENNNSRNRRKARNFEDSSDAGGSLSNYKTIVKIGL
ncbi:hypothetical protein EDEG_03067 [Edhazardia aedis USNM 41457]|uniref:Uncharacterized protein n=1 Tax=Edhazardia aedis (strain USNM 41457) TaxID=1003232 RepID=J8ZS61_EDHAE|nr:hypothetical protein EDEG_03067 [Edhazardia aedis USNM 41457]|eukprot:EJW02528.1 hypothetical protein EDEG_03067 [Edhazardia aedis USNM 41457]